MKTSDDITQIFDFIKEKHKTIVGHKLLNDSYLLIKNANDDSSYLFYCDENTILYITDITTN